MSALLAAGTCIGSPPDGRSRLWWVGPDRRLGWVGDGEPVRLAHRIPGEAPVLAADVSARDPLVVLRDGTTWRSSLAQPWISERGLLAGGGTVQLKKGETRSTEAAESLVLAGVERGDLGRWRLWAVTNARQVIVAAESMGRHDVGTAIPGAAPIIAVRLAGDYGAEALLGDGSLVNWTPGGWVKSGDVLARGNANVTKVRALAGFSLGGGRDVAPGELFEVPPAEARRLIAAGRAAHVEFDAS